MRRAALLCAVTALAAGALVAPARAAFPGVNGPVAYSEFIGDAGNVLFTMGPDGTNPQQLGTVAVFGFDPAYSPDGKRLAFVEGGHLMVANADGSGAVQVPRDDANLGSAESPAWSPDGTHIVLGRSFGSGGAVVDIVDVGTGAEHNLAGNVGFLTGDPAPSWSPDGSRIAYVADAPNGSFTEQDVWIIPATGGAGTAKDITPGTGDNLAPDWSPDGTRLAVSRSVDSNPHIYVMNADGSNAQSVSASADALEPSWSPDGHVIAYEDQSADAANGTLRFVTLGPNGTAVSDVSTRGVGFAPSWRPTDTVPPSISLIVPAEGARFQQGAAVASRYACTDPPPGSQVLVACRGPVPSGAQVDTSALGRHAFTVTARDRMGNLSVVTHTYTVVARPPPTTRILSGPPRRTRSRTARFTFTANVAPVTFACRLDAGHWRPCSGATTDVVKRLRLGVHHFRVRARGAGGVDPRPPERTWTVVRKRFARRARVFSHFSYFTDPREFALFRSVAGQHLPAGVVIRATCQGRGCPAQRRRRWSTRRATASLNLSAWLRGRELRPGARVNFLLSKAGFVSVGKLYCVLHHDSKPKSVTVIGYTGAKAPSCP